MIYKRKYFFLLLLEFSIFILNHQAPTGGRLYVLHLPPPEIHVLGTLGKLDAKRSTMGEPPDEPAVSKSAVVIDPKSSRSESESKRDVEAVDGIAVVTNTGERTINKHSRSRSSAYFDFRDVKGRWPAGTYGLPRTSSGCPSGDGFTWKTGYRFHDTEDDGTENIHSDSFHLAGNFSDEGIRHEFCIKTDELGHGRWPEGKYCVYMKGSRCPAGLEKGFVIWDDENKDNQNDAGGELPEGHYSDDTKIYFCCSTSGTVEQPITLPADKPFFLYAYDSIKCQNVKGMTVTTEFIKFDDEDRGNIDYEGGEYPYGIHKAEKDHMFFLCYYTALKEEQDKKKEEKRRPYLSHKIDKLEQLEKLEKSEKMMDAFLTSVNPQNGLSNRNEKSNTIIKTIRVPQRVQDGKASIIATTAAVVFGAVLIVFATALIVSRHMKTSRNGVRVDPSEGTQYTGSSRRSSFTTTEDEVDLLLDGEYDEDELVEDQYLPSDSELKSGLELMFLKQQRHYWTRKKKP